MGTDSWIETTLGQVVERDGLQTGPFGSQLKAAEYTPIGVPVVMPKDMAAGHIETKSVARVPESIAAERLPQHRVRAGDVLFGRRGDIGRCALVEPHQEGWLCGTGCLRARPLANVDCRFLIQQLLWSRVAAWLIEHAVGQTMLNLNTDILSNLPVTLPPLPEQRKIAAILSSVDEVIEKTEAVIEQLQVVKKSMMQELLTRGLPGRHTRFKQTEIGEIPAEWDTHSLTDVAVVQTGIAKGKATNGNAVALPYLRVANVQDGYLDLSELKTIEVESAQIERYRLRAGDVLFTEGGDADKLGRGCVWSGEVDLCLHQNHIFAVRVNADRLLPQFLSLFGASPAGKTYFLESAKQTTNLASINSTQLKALPVPIPSMDEQRQIVATISACVGRIERERACVQAMNATKASLMSDLLTGELRVTPDEAPA